jgi:hypothetical protein
MIASARPAVKRSAGKTSINSRFATVSLPCGTRRHDAVDAGIGDHLSHVALLGLALPG